ncbi:hypothetical protein [Streptomyces pseudovenezuelae]|uniref:hypothetical protein n=1 Tax=Streptomyces pseudovenezuelae TaxID=67350 RepID=UPI0036E1B471
MRTAVLVAGQATVRPLLNVLRELHIEDIELLVNDFSARVVPVSTPDLVIGVLADNSSSPRTKSESFTNEEVALRLGLMAGRGVPALIIAPPSSPQMHSPDHLITVARCPMTREALVGHVWAFTTSVELSSPTVVTEPQERHLENAGHYLTELDRLESESSAFAGRFERLVGQMLLSAGAAVVENESSRGLLEGRVDIAFMPSARSSDIVLVELKAGLLSEKLLAAAERKLQRFVIHRQAKYGMVLYHDVNGRTLPSRESTPLIVRMSARELIEKLAADPLPKVLDDAVATAVERM